jgi:hypothetical protein
MPEGIVSVRIDRETGCPARAGQANAVFEIFEAGRIPECEAEDTTLDVFNDASGMGDLFGDDAVDDETGIDPEQVEEEDETTTEEDIF